MTKLQYLELALGSYVCIIFTFFETGFSNLLEDWELGGKR